jgi:hypothetical protein
VLIAIEFGDCNTVISYTDEAGTNKFVGSIIRRVVSPGGSVTGPNATTASTSVASGGMRGVRVTATPRCKEAKRLLSRSRQKPDRT